MIDFVSVGAVIADIALVLVFVISISLAYRRGLTLLAFNLICLVITFVAVIALCKPVTSLIYDKTNIDEFFSKHIKNSIGDFIENQIDQSGKINTDKTNIAKPIADKINSYIEEAEKNSVTDVSKYIADKLAYIVISAIVLILLFVVVRLLTIFLRAVLFFITELPFIHSIDKVGGIAYGILRAYLIIYLILAVLSLFSPLMANTGIIAAINNSKICGNFYNNNIFLKILLK